MIRVTCFDGNNFSGKDIRGESKTKYKNASKTRQEGEKQHGLSESV